MNTIRSERGPVSVMYVPGSAAAKRGLEKKSYEFGADSVVVDDDVAKFVGDNWGQEVVIECVEDLDKGVEVLDLTQPKKPVKPVRQPIRKIAKSK